MVASTAVLTAALFLSIDQLVLRETGPLPARRPVLCATESPEQAVTIRIWNRRGGSRSGGSGAIIGTDGRRALVLSCDHIFGSGGVGDVTLWGHGWESDGHVVARDRRRDLSLIVGQAHPGMPVAKIHVREPSRGDRVTLTGCGGNGVIVSRVGSALSHRRAATWSRQGDSGGPAFLDGRICGVVWGTDGGSSYFTPLRDVYRLGSPVDRSAWGAELYQRRDGIELTGLFRGLGRALFGPRSGGKFKGKGRCGPDGCAPFSPPGQAPQGGGAAPGGEPWYAPGFGPDDAAPDDRPENADRPAPDPGDPKPKPPPVGVGGGGQDIQIDLSGFIQRPEFDALSARVNGLASQADIEIVIERVGGLQQTIDTQLTAVNQRIDAIAQPADQDPDPEATTHYVLIADKGRIDQWLDLLRLVDTARQAGVIVETVDSRRMGDTVASPQLVEYTGRTPTERTSGIKSVSLALQRLATEQT